MKSHPPGSFVMRRDGSRLRCCCVASVRQCEHRQRTTEFGVLRQLLVAAHGAQAFLVLLEACSRCHGANQEGLVGPSLINSLKTLSKQDFVTTVTNGRLEKGMPSFKESKMVMENIDHLYAYLKGRSDGAITAAHVYPMK